VQTFSRSQLATTFSIQNIQYTIIGDSFKIYNTQYTISSDNSRRNMTCRHSQKSRIYKTQYTMYNTQYATALYYLQHAIYNIQCIWYPTYMHYDWTKWTVVLYVYVCESVCVCVYVSVCVCARARASSTRPFQKLLDLPHKMTFQLY